MSSSSASRSCKETKVPNENYMKWHSPERLHDSRRSVRSLSPMMETSFNRLGDLIQLQTLPAFVVGEENGCHITELRNLVNLSGTLDILRLENVSSSEEAKICALDTKKYLQNVVLHWTDCVDGFQVLENLQPHTQIEELQIVGYGGAEFPNWIGDCIFSRLATITLVDCKNCDLLPTLGQLPSLQCLSISDMHTVKNINSTFCGRNMAISLPGFNPIRNSVPYNMFNAFPSLEKLTLNGMPMLETWSGIEKGQFPNLLQLCISHCPKLTSLPELSLLVSLQQLEISLCRSLEAFPDKGLPTSLQCLVIIESPGLEEVMLQKGGKKYWGKIARIANIWINDQQLNQGVKEVEDKPPVPALVQPQVDIQSELSHQSGIPRHDDSDFRDLNKKMKTMWTEQVRVSSGTMSEEPQEYGRTWRKYGQKNILGAKFPRVYYRCTHRLSQGCNATKQVQQSDEDLSMFDITYRGKHTCNEASSPVIAPQAYEFQTKMLKPLTTLSSAVGVSTSMIEDSRCVPFQTSDTSAAIEQALMEQDHLEDRGWQEFSEGDQGGAYAPTATGRPSEDGYNWRKYGQKEVKGSKYPWSYYRCTHQNCQAKRKIERSSDGQITEIIYKHCHNHPIPQASRQPAMESAWQESTSSAVTEVSDPLLTYKRKHARTLESADTPEPALGDVTDESESEPGPPVGDLSDDDESELKRRRKDSSLVEANLGSRAVREPRGVVTTESEVVVLDDGYRWRKYGQKPVPGTPFPRGYYKCTSAGCPARKHLERAPPDFEYVTTTYEGMHNHESPAVRSTSHLNLAGGSSNAQASAGESASSASSIKN